MEDGEQDTSLAGDFRLPVTGTPGEIDRHVRLEQSATRHELMFGGQRIVWREWGAGAPVLLLHGGYGSWTHWSRNIAEFARGRRVLVPDTPGFGESDLPIEMKASAIVDQIWRGLDTLVGELSPIDIVGFSYGGGIGGEVAAARPHSVGRLILVGSGGFGLPRSEREPLVQWRKLPPGEQPQAHRRNLEILMIQDSHRIDELAVSIQAGNAGNARMNSKPITAGIALARSLAGKQVSIGGIWGEHDITVGDEGLEGRREIMRQVDPQAEFLVVKGAGHWVQYEAPNEFNRKLSALLSNRRAWHASNVD